MELFEKVKVFLVENLSALIIFEVTVAKLYSKIFVYKLKLILTYYIYSSLLNF